MSAGGSRRDLLAGRSGLLTLAKGRQLDAIGEERRTQGVPCPLSVMLPLPQRSLSDRGPQAALHSKVDDLRKHLLHLIKSQA
jgi:hypothetical protein